jgi:hypothetical protein
MQLAAKGKGYENIIHVFWMHPVFVSEQGGCRGQGLTAYYLPDEFEPRYKTTPRPCGHIEILLTDPYTAPIVKLMPRFYQEAFVKHLLPLNGEYGAMQHCQQQYNMRFKMQHPTHRALRREIQQMYNFQRKYDFVDTALLPSEFECVDSSGSSVEVVYYDYPGDSDSDEDGIVWVA